MGRSLFLEKRYNETMHRKLCFLRDMQPSKVKVFGGINQIPLHAIASLFKRYPAMNDTVMKLAAFQTEKFDDLQHMVARGEMFYPQLGSAQIGNFVGRNKT